MILVLRPLLLLLLAVLTLLLGVRIVRIASAATATTPTTPTSTPPTASLVGHAVGTSPAVLAVLALRVAALLRSLLRIALLL
jgi:hypothetical protein